MIHQAGPAQRQACFVTLAALCAVFLHQQVLSPLENYDNPELRVYNANDLKHLYLGANLLLRSENPYPAANLQLEAARVRHPEMRYLNPYVYPPFAGYFFSWLTWFDYETAKKIWLWMGHILLGLSLALFTLHRGGFTPLYWLNVLLGSTAFFFPLFRSSLAGQLNHVLLFLLGLIFFFWRRDNKRIAGILIGLAALIKVQPAFFLVWLVWKREWSAFGIAIFTILLLVLLPAVHFGLNPYFEYISVLGDMSFGKSTWSDQGAAFYVDPGNIGFPALVYRLFAENPRSQPWLDLGSLPYYLSLAFALGIVGLCFSCCRVQRRDEDPEMELAAWTFGMLLVPSLFWDHYLVLALPAWLILLTRLAQSGVDDIIMLLAAGCWAWCGWKFYWFDPANLSGLRLLYLNSALPPVLCLFLLSLWMAKTSKSRAYSGDSRSL